MKSETESRDGVNSDSQERYKDLNVGDCVFEADGKLTSQVEVESVDDLSACAASAVSVCEECQGKLQDDPESGRRFCTQCGLEAKSISLIQQPFYRKPTSAIAFGDGEASTGNLGTSHLQTFEALRKRGLIRSLNNGQKDAKTFYGIRGIYSNSKALRTRILDNALERLSDIIELGGRKSNHRFANLCGQQLRREMNKLLPLKTAYNIELAQKFINENHPDKDDINRAIATAVMKVDPQFLNHVRMVMEKQNGGNGKH